MSCQASFRGSVRCCAISRSRCRAASCRTRPMSSLHSSTWHLAVLRYFQVALSVTVGLLVGCCGNGFGRGYFQVALSVTVLLLGVASDGEPVFGYFQVALSNSAVASQVIGALLPCCCRGTGLLLPGRAVEDGDIDRIPGHRRPPVPRFPAAAPCGYFQVALSKTVVSMASHVMAVLLSAVVVLGIARYFQVALSKTVVSIASQVISVLPTCSRPGLACSGSTDWPYRNGFPHFPCNNADS
jgi:hypothetical protein